MGITTCMNKSITTLEEMVNNQELDVVESDEED